MKHKFTKNNRTKSVKIGFSWTIFFFGWIALAIRGQYVPALISFLSFNLASLYFMFAGNKSLANQLMDADWQSVGELPIKWVD